MKDGFFYDEFEKWVKDLDVAEEEFETFLKQFLLEQAQRVVRAAKERTPVDTGALRASYQIGGQEIALSYSVDKDGKEHFDLDTEHSQVEDISMVGDNFEVIISNPMEYASYVEYGHRSYQGKYMLTISIDEVAQAMPARFEKQFRQWLVSKGVV